MLGLTKFQEKKHLAIEILGEVFFIDMCLPIGFHICLSVISGDVGFLSHWSDHAQIFWAKMRPENLRLFKPAFPTNSPTKWYK